MRVNYSKTADNGPTSLHATACMQGWSKLCMIGAAINILTIEMTVALQALEHAT